MGDGQPRLLDHVRDRIRRKHYSIRTEQAYVDWIRRFILHHNKRHPRDMGAVEVEGFLTHLALTKGVSASTQNQAKSAVLFLYKEVLGEPLPWLEGIESAKRPARLSVVLTRAEVESDPGTSERHGGIDDPAPLRDGDADHGGRSLTGRVSGFIAQPAFRKAVHEIGAAGSSCVRSVGYWPGSVVMVSSQSCMKSPRR